MHHDPAAYLPIGRGQNGIYRSGSLMPGFFQEPLDPGEKLVIPLKC